MDSHSTPSVSPSAVPLDQQIVQYYVNDPVLLQNTLTRNGLSGILPTPEQAEARLRLRQPSLRRPNRPNRPDVVGNTTTHRPSNVILNSGLRFDHFVSPFSVTTDTKQLFEDFVSIGDALDFAIIRHRQIGGHYTILDANDENIYTIEA